MRLQQLVCLCEIIKRGLSVSAAAASLRTSQPAVSRQLRALERELGIEIFVRRHKRLIGLTAEGRAALAAAQRMLAEAERLLDIGRDASGSHSGVLVVATTHTQARHALPKVVKRFTTRYPEVEITLRQGTPATVADMVRAGEADIAIASEGPRRWPELVLLPAYRLERVVLTPPGHPLLRARPLTLERLVEHPIITYDEAFVGRSRLVRAFEAKGLKPRIALSAIDTDVIKTYVETGLGVGIVAKIAYDARRDRALRAIDARHLFESNTIYVTLRRHSALRRYAFDFIEWFAPHLEREAVARALRGEQTGEPPNVPVL
ncbi:MAG TPA: LysR substrate-binding domain-containing protein [Burkholderiales bacterium]|nr:LysR substrate-binding domain-containing protein [Burkholderiales bacterium]